MEEGQTPYNDLQSDVALTSNPWDPVLFYLPFYPVDHILSDLSTMTLPSWVAPQAWLSFIELDKAVVRAACFGLFCALHTC